MSTDPLWSIADDLYACAPEEFTAARGERAAQAKAGGDRELSGRVGTLRKPSRAAWVVNMLVRHHAGQMSQVLELGAALRAAQSDLDGDALRELTRQRRQLTTAVTRQGRVLAAELGHPVTDAVADQVQSTLHAAMVDETAARAAQSGLLVSSLSSTGVEEADVLGSVAVPGAVGMTPRPLNLPSGRTSRAGRAGLSVVPDPQPAQTGPDAGSVREAELADAREAVRQARDGADSARRRTRKAAKKATKVQARTLQAAEELEEARGRVAELEHELDTLDEAASRADERTRRAEATYADAQEALAGAQAHLADLEG